MPTATTIDHGDKPQVRAICRQLDRLEERLPALPAATLRLQRTIADHLYASVHSATMAIRTSLDSVTRTTAASAKTVTGTARWAADRTVETAATGANTVAGQARAQAEIAADTAGTEAADIGHEVQQTMRDIGSTATKVVEAVENEIDDSEASPVAYEKWTKERLYGRAQDLDIEGRSTMTKNELVEALRAA